ncbi:PREDICTED: uncharacterized protein LOC105957453 [Erythranthe guttata]|uniref:uncharacterized protein LOC105957453 n=1 Tax=Erythranthe guttata TaxID=4155 RepID=UPI00064D9268|nr:PREDICTED: uncharacterized protein LOC105957453 [Erythranthe guttata]|eukprot:XP_012836828.1 PREDICTED: uncharacterized protein LOC105957453 [Erythranthe guttata]
MPERRHTPSASPAEKKSRKSSKKVRPTAVEVSPVPVTTDLDPVSTLVASPSPSLKTSDVPDPVDTGMADLDGDSLSATPQDDLPSDPEVAPRNVEFPFQLHRSNRKHEGPSVSTPASVSKGQQSSSSEPIPEDDPLRSESSDSSVGSQLSAGISNWFPTTHNAILNPTQAEFLWCITHDLKINIGKLIFNQIGALANSQTEREHLPFPSLIYQLLIKQGLPTRDATLLDPPGRPITIHGPAS